MAFISGTSGNDFLTGTFENDTINSAALVIVTAGSLLGTYIIVNDSTAGFQSTIDTVINITGQQGTLPNIGSIPVSDFFV